MREPFAFCASERPFTVQLNTPCIVTGYTQGDQGASYYRPVPVKTGDTFQAAPGGLLLNGVLVPRKSTPLKKMVYKVSWVAKSMRVAVFLDRDRAWSKRLKRFTKKLGRPYWSAIDLRSYHVGCGKEIPEAVKNLMMQVQATNLLAEEKKAQGYRVIRWRCLLHPKEVADYEARARATGFILDDVLTPPLPEKWQKDLEKLKRKA